jgi:hypothetical protein
MLVFFITSLPHHSTSLSSFNNLSTSFITMAYILTPVKTAVVEFSKSFPDVAMAEEIDFETWGHKFVVIVVSCSFALRLLDSDLRILE